MPQKPRAASASGSSKMPTPERPKFRSLVDMARDFSPGTPWFLAGDPLLGYTEEEKASGVALEPKDFTTKGQFAVLVRPFKTKQILAYTAKYGCSPDTDMRKIFFVWQEFAKMLNPELAKLYGEPMSMDDMLDKETGAMRTELGMTHGTLDNHMMMFAGELLAAHGRVVGRESSTGEWQLEPIALGDIVEHLSHPRMLFDPQEGDGTQYFYTLLEESGLWDATLIDKELDALGEKPTEEEALGNSQERPDAE